MFEGWLELGGLEITSAPRAFNYARTAECQVTWLRDEMCPGIVDALNDAPYDASNIQSAPWYDADIEASSRFYGVYPIAIEGLDDSTRQATITEGILSGGTIGGYRDAVRTVRLRAILIAYGEDALTYGKRWLNAALTPGNCHIHGTACGEADLRFFTSCPPPRPDVPVYTEWAETARNLATNPSFETEQDIPVGAVRSSDWAASGTYSIYVPFEGGYGRGPYGHGPYGHG